LHDGTLRRAVHKLKYDRDIGLGEVLAKCMIGVVQSLDARLDLAIPIPLGAERLRQRGYNQAALLARPLAYHLNLPYCPQALRRIRETRTQVGLDRAQRLQNVAGAFQADPDSVGRKNVLLVDDVMTTGATLDAAARALCQAGAEGVWAVALARAVDIHTS
jgi:ComF family protein